MYTLTLKAHNRNFMIALEWTRTRMPHLFEPPLDEIIFVPSSYPGGWMGLHKWVGNESFILIRNGKLKVEDFIDTLCHELMHVVQYDGYTTVEQLKREKIEKEADAVGYHASELYRKENGLI